MGSRDRRIFEIMLILVTIGMTVLFFRMGSYKLVALNLFFLPIVLSGYFLGRTSAGVLALLCALTVTIATAVDARGFAAFQSPVMIGMALTVWAAVLGLTAILVGTLCDERSAKVRELHEAYIGVVEVLSRYLQNGNPRSKARSVRVAETCQHVAEALRLNARDVDDIRVGALLYDLGNVEITTKLINRAVDTLEAKSDRIVKHTFLGLDLVQSLGSVLHGAVPLLLSDEVAVHERFSGNPETDENEVPIGARIIRAVRQFDGLLYDAGGTPRMGIEQVLRQLRKEHAEEYGHDVLGALESFAHRLSVSWAMPRPVPL